VEITKEEEQGAKIAILLHDIGHGPYSHALERKLIKGVHHEDISMLILQLLNEQFNGKLRRPSIFSRRLPEAIPAPAGIGPAGCGPDGLPDPRFVFYRCIRRRDRLRPHPENAHRA
jgi:HD superfamily phosphohydrolase